MRGKTGTRDQGARTGDWDQGPLTGTRDQGAKTGDWEQGPGGRGKKFEAGDNRQGAWERRQTKGSTSNNK